MTNSNEATNDTTDQAAHDPYSHAHSGEEVGDGHQHDDPAGEWYISPTIPVSEFSRDAGGYLAEISPHSLASGRTTRALAEAVARVTALHAADKTAYSCAGCGGVFGDDDLLSVRTCEDCAYGFFDSRDGNECPGCYVQRTIPVHDNGCPVCPVAAIEVVEIVRVAGGSGDLRWGTVAITRHGPGRGPGVLGKSEIVERVGTLVVEGGAVTVVSFDGDGGPWVSGTTGNEVTVTRDPSTGLATVRVRPAGSRRSRRAFRRAQLALAQPWRADEAAEAHRGGSRADGPLLADGERE